MRPVPCGVRANGRIHTRPYEQCAGRGRKCKNFGLRHIRFARQNAENRPKSKDWRGSPDFAPSRSYLPRFTAHARSERRTIGRESGRESVCQYVSLSVVSVYLKKNKNKNKKNIII